VVVAPVFIEAGIHNSKDGHRMPTKESPCVDLAHGTATREVWIGSHMPLSPLVQEQATSSDHHNTSGGPDTFHGPS